MRAKDEIALGDPSGKNVLKFGLRILEDKIHHSVIPKVRGLLFF